MVIPISNKFSSHFEYVTTKSAEDKNATSPLKHSSSANNTILIPVNDYVEIERPANDLRPHVNLSIGNNQQQFVLPDIKNRRFSKGGGS